MTENKYSETEHAGFPTADFADLLASNREFAAGFQNQNLTGQAKQGLAVITCIDSRIDPLSLLGLKAGDAKIIRNAGARVTEDVLRTLVLASYLLNVSRVLLMPHTLCKMASATEDQIHETIRDKFNVDTRSLEFRVTDDVVEAAKSDLTRIRAYPLLPADLAVGAAIYDVSTGELSPIDW